MEECPKRVWIVYASQTGRSERISFEVRDELWKIGVAGYPTSIEDFEDIFFDFFNETGETLEEKLNIEFPMTIFILSTTGQGEVPDTMVSFWNRFLLNIFNSELIKRFNFTIFGMGDRCFGNERFNITARKLRHSLLSLGAQEKVPWGLGDESHDFGVLGEFDPWIENLLRMFSSPEKKKKTDTDQAYLKSFPVYKFKYRIFEDSYLNYEFEDGLENEIKDSINKQLENISKTSGKYLFPNITRVFSNKECEKESKNKQTKKIKFEIKLQEGENKHNIPGSHIAVWPTNPIEKTIEFIGLLNNTQISPRTVLEIIENTDFYKCPCKNINQKCQFSGVNTNYLTKYLQCFVKKNLTNFPLNQKMTVFTLVYRYLDIMNIPERRFLNLCSEKARDDMHKGRLSEMIQKNLDSRKDYSDYIRDEHRNHVELLWDFNSIQLTIDEILEYIPIIIPRYYSVCNAPGWYGFSLWRSIEIWNHFKMMEDTENLVLSNNRVIPEIMLTDKFSMFLPFKNKFKDSHCINCNSYYSYYNIYKKLKNRLLFEKIKRNMEEYIRLFIGGLEVSDFTEYSDIVEICVDIIEWNTAFNRKIRGLCSGFLNDKTSKYPEFGNFDKILVAFENKLGNGVVEEIVDPNTPILLISCGLGITGIISILQERVLRILKAGKTLNADKNNCLVYIGMRYSNVKYPYLDQIYDFSRRKELKDLVKINISYSRKFPGIQESIFYNETNLGEKRAINLNRLQLGSYIQSLLLIQEDIDEIVNCILNGYIIVCGNALTMPMEMRETLAKVLIEKKVFENLQDSMIYVKKLIRYGRYIEETWK
ncbi:NADPH-dependent diflavin oxidoreductase 1 [Cryptosporidium felis]|nr:NADPH-dependent diflavin oxidoreductase 1 [Cryptosporidium felis]